MHPAVKSLVLFCASLAAACVVLESGVWLWLRYLTSDEQLLRYGTLEQNSRRLSSDISTETIDKARLTYTPHRYIGYIPTPGFRRGKNFHNSRGFRGEEFPAKKPTGEFRIVCLGGSTTYGTNVEDPLQAYPAQLERVLKARGFASVRVINAGAAGWTSYETFANFVFRVRYLNPDLLVIYDGVNDAAARMVYPHRAYQGDNSGFIAPATSIPDQPFYLASNALRCLVIRLGWAASPMSLHQTMGALTSTGVYFQFLYEYEHGRFPSGIFEKISIGEIFAHNPPIYFVQNLRNLIVLSKAAKIQPVLLTFHINPGLKGLYSQPEFMAGVAQQNERVSALAAETGVPLLDFAALFPDRPEDYDDPIHLNESGCRRQAEVIAEFLEKEALVRK